MKVTAVHVFAALGLLALVIFYYAHSSKQVSHEGPQKQRREQTATERQVQGQDWMEEMKTSPLSRQKDIMQDDREDADVIPGLVALREAGAAGFLGNRDMGALQKKETFLTYHSYLDNTNVLCERKIRMGNLGDGGWEVCDDKDVRPKKPCLVYSFGINDDFSFDDDVAGVYNCQVYSFDPSMDSESYNRSDNVHFYKIGLGNVTQTTKRGWKLKTLGDIRAMLGHENSIIDILKMDIEQSEWLAIPEMVASGQLSSVRQFYVEYHGTPFPDIMRTKLKAIQMIEQEGFRKFYVHKNPACKTRVFAFPVVRTGCYEIHYMKR